MKLQDASVSESIKMLLIGDSGAGKTGALASLARAGYDLRILDFDRGTEILANLLRDEPEARSNIDVEICTDTPVRSGDKQYLRADGFKRAMKVLDDWPGLGKPNTWGPETVIVLDSLTMCGESMLRYVLQMNGRPFGPAQIQDWGAAMSLQEDMLAILYSDSIRANVIVTSHVKFLNQDGDPVSYGYPNALGKKLPPVVGRYFNSTLMVKSKRVAGSNKRIIYTDTTGLVELKTAAPGRVAKEYPIETGLAEYFEAIRGPLQRKAAA